MHERLNPDPEATDVSGGRDVSRKCWLIVNRQSWPGVGNTYSSPRVLDDSAAPVLAVPTGKKGYFLMAQ